MTDNNDTTNSADIIEFNTSLHPSFCLTSAWIDCVADEAKGRGEAIWVQAAKEGRWAHFAQRVNGKRSEAIWSKQSVSDWFFIRWGFSHEGCLKKLVVQKGFPEPEQFRGCRRGLEAHRGKGNVAFDDIMKVLRENRDREISASKAETAALAKNRKRKAKRHHVRAPKRKAPK